MWSCGLVFYMLFAKGKHPIYESNMSSEEFYQKVFNFQYTFPSNMDKLIKNYN